MSCFESGTRYEEEKRDIGNVIRLHEQKFYTYTPPAKGSSQALLFHNLDFKTVVITAHTDAARKAKKDRAHAFSLLEYPKTPEDAVNF